MHSHFEIKTAAGQEIMEWNVDCAEEEVDEEMTIMMTMLMMMMVMMMTVMMMMIVLKRTLTLRDCGGM